MSMSKLTELRYTKKNDFYCMQIYLIKKLNLKKNSQAHVVKQNILWDRKIHAH